MSPSTVASGNPSSLDQLIPLIGDAIEHAQSLQGIAEGAVNGVKDATKEVTDAVVRLEQAKAALTSAIAQSVRKEMNSALQDSSATMGTTLTTAESTATEALNALSVAAGSTKDALLDAAHDLDVKKWKYILLGLGIGIALGGSCVWAYWAHNDLNRLVNAVYRRSS